MNNYGHRGPDQSPSDYRVMGHAEFMESTKIVRDNIAYLGFNLRLYNQNCPESKMSIMDVVQAIVDDRKDKRIEMAAAVNCMQRIQFMMKCLYEHKSRETKWSIKDHTVK